MRGLQESSREAKDLDASTIRRPACRRSECKTPVPSCGETVEKPYKTRELVAPYPDKEMRITVTIFGMFKCPSSGRSFRGVVDKAKMGTAGKKV
ncbi:MAG: chromatin protein Cren7 [Candidatus Bathyarchaeota archaeon]|nr:chromatin protein Cren7 [Candidatus Bathyarchaeota archaeon]